MPTNFIAERHRDTERIASFNHSCDSGYADVVTRRLNCNCPMAARRYVMPWFYT